MKRSPETDAIVEELWQRLNDCEEVFTNVEVEIQDIRKQLVKRREERVHDLREVKLLYFVFGVLAAIIALYIVSFF